MKMKEGLYKKLDTKTKIDVDRLKERQQDLEKISKISIQLLELSRSMKISTENQGRIVSSIEDHITIANEKVKDGNEQLSLNRQTQATNVKLYFWICISLGIILLIGLSMMYWKYLRVKNNTTE